MTAPLALVTFLLAADPSPIRDNSFLLEEAYNQEPGVVQHILTFQRGRHESWASTFTQEWPVRTGRHQISFTLAALDPGPQSPGFGDVALHWRYQLVGGDEPAAVAPRVSVLLPIGDPGDGLGAGGPGVQINLPLSVEIGKRFVTHTNVGATYLSDAENLDEDEADLTLFNFGQSLVWHARPLFDVLVETVFLSGESVVAPDTTEAEQALFVSPGIRWAHDLRGGLQIVPGIALPWGLGPSRGDRAVFLYLSFEHALRR